MPQTFIGRHSYVLGIIQLMNKLGGHTQPRLSTTSSYIKKLIHHASLILTRHVLAWITHPTRTYSRRWP